MTRPTVLAVGGRVFLPSRLDDDWVESAGTGLRAIAAEQSGPELLLDARRLRVVSIRGIGLLAAVRLIAAQRGTAVTAVECRPDVAAVMGLARISVTPSIAAGRPGETRDEPSPRHDWTPWWTGFAANA